MDRLFAGLAVYLSHHSISAICLLVCDYSNQDFVGDHSGNHKHVEIQAGKRLHQL